MTILPRSVDMVPDRRAIRAAVAAWILSLAFATAVVARTNPPPSWTPDTDLGRYCQPMPKLRPTRDWSKWDKSQPVPDPVEMYDVAIAYAEGRRDINRDPTVARRLLEDLAERPWPGRSRAHFRLGKLFLDPVAGPVDAERAAAHLTTASAMQNMDASVQLAQLHAQRRFAEASAVEAERLLRAASAAGHVGGLVGLARLERSDRIGPEPRARVDDLVRLALQALYDDLGKGKCGALFEIGSILSQDDLVPGGVTEAVTWLEAASRQGDSRADLALAEIYLQDRVKAAPDRVLGYLERAAEAGQPRAMTLLGEHLLIGDRALKDVATAIAWLGRAGLNADPEAYMLLARHYRGAFGGMQDLPKAAEALTKASALPSQATSILVGLARLHAAGVNGRPDRGAALALYQQAAARGDVGSLTEMAKLLLADPQGDRSDEILRLLKEAAARGNPDAMGVLADLYTCGTVVAPDAAQAEAWLERAAEAGHVRSLAIVAQTADPAVAQRNAAALARAAGRGNRESMALLSLAYHSGQGVTADDAAAVHWREEALKPGEGRSRAILLLARAMLNGDEGLRDEPGARALLEQASLEDDSGVQLELGRLLTDRHAPSSDIQKGVQLLRKAAASGNAAAMVALAELPDEHIRSTGRTALDWMRGAAEAGHVRAAILLASGSGGDAAHWLSRAEALPVCTVRDKVDLARIHHRITGSDDPARARFWMTRALADIQTGPSDPSALFLVGRAMVENVGGVSDKQEGLKYVELSAKAGRIDAMRFLGRSYVSGQAGGRGAKTAITWLSKALQNGDAAVATDLARLAVSPGVEGGEALAALKESAESGFAPAMREFGKILQLGIGLVADPQGGAVFLRGAAEAGDVVAMKELSRAYASGYGVELSARASTEWLQRAAQAGDTEAMHGLSVAMTLGFGTDVNGIAVRTSNPSHALGGMSGDAR